MTTTSARAPAAPEDLLARFRSTRDPEALGALFDLTAPQLLRVALSIAPDAASAENALQETFLAVLAAPERWDETRPVTPWLLGILHRQVGKVRRDGARRPDPFRVVPPISDDPSALASSNEEQARVRAAIDDLPEPYRAVAVLRWRHGLDPADIADVRGEPPGTTRSLLSRALEKLRERLGGGALALFGVPGTRGLAGIRRAVMSRATAATAAGTAAATTVAVAGGAIVMKKVAVACVVVLLLLGGGTWWTATRTSPPAAAPRPREVAAPDAAAERKRSPAPQPPLAAEPSPVDLDRCDRELDLFGRVTDEAGVPVAGASVATERFPWRSVGIWSKHYVDAEAGPSTRTAKDGTFAVRLARGDRFDLRVSATGFGEVVRTDCPAGERVEVVLRRGATLDVTTVDESGAPVPGVRVELRRDQRRFAPYREERKAVTDAAGHAALDGLLPGPVAVSFLHPTLGEPKRETRTMPAAGTLAIRVTMRAGRTITGRVTDAATGSPIAGARVDNWNFQREVTTDADGRYTLRGWTSHESMPVAAKAEGYCSAYRDSAGGDVVDFALPPGDRVTGRLVDEHGAPVANAIVGAYGSAPQSRGSQPQRPTDSDAMRTADDGRFELGGLSRDLPHTLAAVAPGRARTLVAFDRHFWTGAVIDLGDVEMKPARSVEGVVVDLEGKPLADATVRLAANGVERGQPGAFLFSQTRRTDDLGRFRFADLAAGTYGATVSAMGAPRGPPARIDLPDDEDVRGLHLTLAGGGSVTLLVVDETGAPAEGVTVYADVNEDSKNDGLLAVAAGPDGRATFRGLRAVATKFNVGRDDGRHVTWVGPVVPEGQEIRVVAPREAVVEGTTADADGRPLASYVTATLRRDGSAAGSAASDETGRFAIKVPVGEIVDLWARGTIPDAHGAKFTGFEGRLAGVTGPKSGVAITLRAVAVTYDRTLTVVVQDSTGVPFPGVELGIYEPPKEWKVKTDADGRARFEGLPSRLVVVNFAELQDLAPQHPLDIAPRLASVVPAGEELVVRYRAGAAIRGRVVDGEGRGVADAYVQVTTSDGTYLQFRGDADGRFVASGLPGTRHTLTAQAIAGGERAAGTVENVVPGDAEVTITVAPPAK